jgi:hypothetical protein
LLEEKFREERVRVVDVDVKFRYIPPPCPVPVVFAEQDVKFEEVIEREEEEIMCFIAPPVDDVVAWHETLQLSMVVTGKVSENE